MLMQTIGMRLVTTASIIFENANADISAKCEWVFILSPGLKLNN